MRECSERVRGGGLTKESLQEAHHVAVADGREEADLVERVLDLALRHLADLDSLERVELLVALAHHLVHGGEGALAHGLHHLEVGERHQ